MPEIICFLYSWQAFFQTSKMPLKIAGLLLQIRCMLGNSSFFSKPVTGLPIEKIINPQLQRTARKRIIDIPRDGGIQKVQKGNVGFLVQHQSGTDGDGKPGRSELVVVFYFPVG